MLGEQLGINKWPYKDLKPSLRLTTDPTIQVLSHAPPHIHDMQLSPSSRYPFKLHTWLQHHEIPNRIENSIPERNSSFLFLARLVVRDALLFVCVPDKSARSSRNIGTGSFHIMLVPLLHAV